LRKLWVVQRAEGRVEGDEPSGSRMTGVMPGNWVEWRTTIGSSDRRRTAWCRWRWGKERKIESFFHLKGARDAGVCGRVGSAGMDGGYSRRG
jgi:hypothetical protein